MQKEINTTFELMHKDVPVATIELKDGEINIVQIKNKNLLPINVDSAMTLSQWNEERCIPFERPSFNEILNSYQCNNINDLIPRAYMCSLTDNYWFKPECQLIEWKDVNFYDNNFNSNLYKKLFFNNQETINNFLSPDLTTCGVLAKYWFQDQNGNFILRKESKLYEAESEYIASQIAKHIGVSAVPYKITSLQDRVCSDCPSFITNDNFEFVPMKIAMDKTQNNDPLKLIQYCNLQTDFEKIMLIDCIMQNTDRHLYNYGFIINSNSQKILGMSPMFDTGASCIDMECNFLEYQPTGKSFAKTFSELSDEVKNLINNFLEKDLEKIIESIPSLTNDEKEKIIIVMSQRLQTMQKEYEREEHNIER